MAHYIDTHVHLYDEAFAGEEDAVLERALEAGVVRMIQPDIDSRERAGMLALAARHPGVLYCMLGLYPGSVDENWRKEIDAMAGLLDEASPVAIGEIGLDYHWSPDTAGLQKEAFTEQLHIAAERDLPVNIHLREATDDFFGILEKCRHLNLRGSIHAFSGSYETFRRLSGYGDWYVGIGGVLTFRNSRLPEAVKRIPLDRIVLETDAPYLAPDPFRGRRNESSYIPLIAGAIARIKGISTEEVAETTGANADNLFSLI